ncbi:MAG: CoA transferase [Chloroflexi bacterium]|nr:CoA transferase [Chloroflexota bacterium]
MTKALESIKVIHLSRTGPGHYCAMQLSDYGADVLNIEQPGYAAQRASGSAVSFARPRASNRNHRSMTLNLREPEGKGVFLKLIKGADVLIEGFRPGVTQRLGIGYDALEKINPRLVYCALSGYGQEGAYKGYVGHDINYMSYAGIVDLTGHADGPPIIPGMNMADMAASVHGALGILTAIIAREKTGQGQFVDISYLDGMVAWHVNVADGLFHGDPPPTRGGRAITGAQPCYNVYEAKDGKWLSLGCNEPWFWQNLCKALGREDYIPYQSAEGEKKDEIFRELRKIFKTRTRDEWISYFHSTGTDIACAPVYSFGEVFADPNITERMVVEVEHPGAGKARYVAPPFKLSKTPFRIETPPPCIGQHTDEVLKGLGYDSTAIQSLREKGIIE